MMYTYANKQAVKACSIWHIYIIQAWADWRCLSILRGNARA